MRTVRRQRVVAERGRRIPLALAIVVFAFAGCDAPRGGEQPEVASDVSLRHARTISWNPADSAVLRPFDLVVVDGRILIPDRGANNLRILDLEGRLLSVVGGEGQGPGEFRDLRNIGVSLDGSRVALSDSRNHRVSLYDSSGVLVGDFIPDGPGVGAVAFDSEGRLHVDALGPLESDGIPGSPTVGIYLQSGERVDAYGNYLSERHPIADRLNNLVRFAVRPQSEWLVWSYRGLLEKRSRATPDGSSFEVELPHPDIEVLTGPFVTEVSGNAVAVTRLPVAQDIAADARGRVYVLTVRADGEGTASDQVLVYSADGTLLRTLRLESQAHRIAFSSDSLYALRRAGGRRILPSIHVYASGP